VSFAWCRIKADPITIAGGIVLGFVLSGAAGWLFGSIAGASSGTTAAFFRGLGSLTNWIVSSFMIGGITRFCLKIARDQSYGFDELFCGRATFFPILIAELLLAIGASIGFALLIVPGVIFTLGMSLTIALIVDRGLDPLAAMKESWRMTTGQKGRLFSYALLVLLLSLVGLLACGVGVLVVAAMAYLGHTFIYLKLAGQPAQNIA
jgi:uncharacterized membrane protein